MADVAGNRPVEPDHETLLTGADATILRRLSRNISNQGGAMFSSLRRAFTNASASDSSNSEHQVDDVEAGQQATNSDSQGQSSQGQGAAVVQQNTAPALPADAGSTPRPPLVTETPARASSAPPTQLEESRATSEITASPASPSAGAAAPTAGFSTAAGSTSTHSIFGRLLRTNSGHVTSRGPGQQQPVCLICLENLGPDDFESGEAMQLECQCRGELAMRHRVCAEKWSRVKGDRVCDVCKAPIMNLPEITPRAPGSAGSDENAAMFDEADGRDHVPGMHGAYMSDQIPGSADIIFDCIRVTWVAMIICILFFEMPLAMALWTGLIVGLAYTGFARAMYRTQLAAIQREMARDRERGPHGNDSPGPPMVVVV
ncbi:hypothetical protein WJX73_009205 [Symbiochloris irregularis]|uniref:RING-CH-type domain-containing protein n=1 Tax=Symbiochloris irregularis TaxID=706552 RepID=A0AAW1PZD3_9CHLO